MGEILGLKWKDFDCNSGNIQIQRQVQRRKGEGLVFCPPKSASGNRMIKLGKTTQEKQIALRNKQHHERMLVGEKWQD